MKLGNVIVGHEFINPGYCKVRFGAHYGLKADFVRSLQSAPTTAVSYPLLDHLISAGEKREWHVETDGLRGFEVDGFTAWTGIGYGMRKRSRWEGSIVTL